MEINILYYTDYDLTIPDGPTINEIEFLDVLISRLGRSVGVAIPNTKPFNKYNINKLYKVNHLIQNPYLGFFSGLFIALKLIYIFKKNKFNLLVIRLPHMPWSVYLIAKFSNIPYVIKTVGMFWNINDSNSLRSKIGWKIQEYLSIECIKKSLHIDAVTYELAQEIEKRTDYQNISVIPNATNIQKFKPDLSDSHRKSNHKQFNPIIGYVGLCPSKRAMDQLAYFMKKYSNHFLNVKIIVAGWDEGMPKRIKELKQDGLSNKFEILGLVNYEKIPEIINKIHVGVSFDEPHRARKVGNSSQKVRQYLACGKPVVSMDIGNEFIRDNDLGMLVPVDDLSLAAEGINQVLNNLTTNRNYYSERCRDYAVRNLSTSSALDQRLKIWKNYKVNI